MPLGRLSEKNNALDEIVFLLHAVSIIAKHIPIMNLLWQVEIILRIIHICEPWCKTSFGSIEKIHDLYPWPRDYQ